MHHKNSHIKGVGGAVYRHTHDGQLEWLLIKKKHGFWTLPKGHVKSGESYTTAAIREVAEETGIQGEVKTCVSQVDYHIYKNSKKRYKVVTYYLIHALDGVLCPDHKEQIEQLGWFSTKEALRRIQRDRVRAIVQQAVMLLSNVRD
ncbi:MAG: hypothetical protein GFH27_549301n282 [Chloroflexi bacterium AL-W]|nr:hypothetical protein [Chloroflexi bacterium AL-N1]NOK68476.1 hypothetical protein [Chloroflexi bacterium AL-N10]NOK74122.1 hypothetical protein [Chloroflexi bacterium AL-N5]NOK83089.1 hypothetical protein [Chloroflexi bacterium AL-W]NOK90612.1 hypothetical protein [Chloroflexi bacterium AL-N15]